MIDSHCHLDCIDVSEREGGVQSVLDLAREHASIGCYVFRLPSKRRVKTARQSLSASVGECVHPSHEELE